MKVDTLIFKKIAYTQAKLKKTFSKFNYITLSKSMLLGKIRIFLPDMTESCIAEIVER